MFMRPYGSWRSTRREMETLRREMNRLFTEWPRQARWFPAPEYPAMNVWTKDDVTVVTAELPGINPEDIDISVEDDTMVLKGNREPDETPENTVYHRRERKCGSFSRTFRLPFRVDADKVQASFAKGVLSITLPRAEADKPKKITIKSA
jgi:HSP20 family protein